MEFATSIHCMDGRIQEPLIHFIKSRYNIKYIDTITEPGPCKILSQNIESTLIESIDNRVSISLNKHGSNMIFISGHHDCAGNPVSEDIQIQQIIECEKILQSKYPDIKIVKLWIDEHWKVKEF
jgi:hypothetical protein